METKFLKIDINSFNTEDLKEAGEIIRAGGLVAFPTETVYGLGGDGLNKESSKKIYEAKGRPSDNPLIIHIADLKDIFRITTGMSDKALMLAESFWPGPLTMILKKAAIVPFETTGGLDTVAVRMPDNKIALEFIKSAGGYVAAPSANLSGRPSPTTAEHVCEDMNGRIDMIIDGGSSTIGLESTIVDMTEDVPIILRPGYITMNSLSRVVGDVVYDPAILDLSSDEPPRAPGMKYRHYAPKGDLAIVKGEKDKVIDYIRRQTEAALSEGERVGIIATEETYLNYSATEVQNIGPRDDEATIARRLYAVLREFDEDGITRIYSEDFDTPNMGQAIMNRLIKAAGHHIINLSN
ncbi:MAG: L-threonylcarbamoyladenylate synthase [Lachnospiraceae bacterium]|nr:L-threonylcarbamoyladenylate synthase [Lachnospiraceae bacterium]